MLTEILPIAPEGVPYLAVDTAPDAPPPAPEPAPPRRMARVVWDGLTSASEWAFGAVALGIGLAVLSAMPVVQLLSLGYLLEAGGRVARTGRLRDALIGVRKAARVGSIVVGGWLLLLPVRFVASLASSAELIDPGGPIARRWRIGLIVLTVAVVVQIVAACARGGRFRYFFWPLNPIWLVRRLFRGGFYASARDGVWDFVAALHLPHYFRLGLLGFIGTLAWLAVPVTLFAVGRKAPVLGVLGALLLGVVALALPFLQVRFAVEGRFRALFEYRGVRDRFRRAPWAFALAALLTLVFSVPLYLLKIEMIPRETAWLPSLVFLLFIFPARVAAGWAYGRSLRRERPRHWFFRGSTRLALLPVAALYVLIVFLSQYTAWNGIQSLYQQHAFLLPVPFLSMP